MDTGDTVNAAAGAQLCEDEGPLAAHGALRHQVWNNLTNINFLPALAIQFVFLARQ